MKTTLYLGTDPSYFPEEGHVIHYPVIQIVPRSLDDPELKKAFDDLEEYTHFVFTSKNAVQIFFGHLKKLGFDKEVLKQKIFIAVGRVTATYLTQEGITPKVIANEETQEGLVKEISCMEWEDAYVFFPRSSLSRPVLVDFMQQRAIRHQSCSLYDTLSQKIKPVPDLKKVDEIVFTSPSTVDAFFKIYRFIPQDKKLVVMGPITEEALKNKMKEVSRPLW